MLTKDISISFSYGLPIGVLDQFLVESHLMARNREQEVPLINVVEAQGIIGIGRNKVNLSRYVFQRGDEDPPADQTLFPQALKAKLAGPLVLNNLKECSLVKSFGDQ